MNSWHEMGIYDAPAMIDKILAVPGLSKISYIAYSMGTAQYLVMLSERPEYNAKIEKGVLLAPAAIINQSTSPIRVASILQLNINGRVLIKVRQ
jgi:lysosomal acid lipase/cholesteryl ester hydrolase